MTPDEKTLAAEITRRVLADEPDADPARTQVLRHRAEEIAAEMIWASRAPDPDLEEEWDEEELGPDPLDLRRSLPPLELTETQLDELEAEDEAEKEAFRTEVRRLRSEHGPT